ncbi:MAG TPA: NAD-dependent epimerase/dehydratase family protein [Streptosporangiaceae bacterium]|nr:NAD-dependent epimerase/dehydratase family protein [Streptosporangiaceae bacterium]
MISGQHCLVPGGAGPIGSTICASSASVCGLADECPWPERHHPYPNDTLYGAAKTFGEGLLPGFQQMRGHDYVALRYFNGYGRRTDGYGRRTDLLINWMARISAGEPPEAAGGLAGGLERLVTWRRAGRRAGALR